MCFIFAICHCPIRVYHPNHDHDIMPLQRLPTAWGSVFFVRIHWRRSHHSPNVPSTTLPCHFTKTNYLPETRLRTRCHQQKYIRHSSHRRIRKHVRTTMILNPMVSSSKKKQGKMMMICHMLQKKNGFAFQERTNGFQE